jgi:D-alanyl-lipoteichoic acid acyltransferase DltB (MBOAT superfamily)
MALNNFYFMVAFIPLFIVLLLLQAFRAKCDKGGRMQLLVLLVFSYFFICYSDIRFGVCLVIVTAIAYITGLLIELLSNKRPILAGAGGWDV